LQNGKEAVEILIVQGQSYEYRRLLYSKIATYGGKMLEKQDETIAVIKEEGEKIRRELGNKIDNTKEELKYEVLD